MSVKTGEDQDGLIRGELRALRDPEFVVHVDPDTLIEPPPMSKRFDRYVKRSLP